MSNVPKKIYLHDPFGYFDDESYDNTVTWSEDMIDVDDIEYIRADSDAMLNKVGELLPCPFCGGKADVHFGRSPSEIDEFVYCINRYCNTTKNSIAEWNKRANFA